MTIINSFLVSLFCVSFAWGWVSMALCFRSLRKLGLDGKARLRLFSGPRPNDPDEYHAWQLGWHFMCAVLAMILCMIAIPLCGCSAESKDGCRVPHTSLLRVGILTFIPAFHLLATTRNCFPKSGHANFNFKYKRSIHSGCCRPAPSCKAKNRESVSPA